METKQGIISIPPNKIIRLPVCFKTVLQVVFFITLHPSKNNDKPILQLSVS
jgi:hypothetical protein